MATGAPGTNGVWLYGEDDSEATFSALLNKAGTTVNTQLGLDRTRLTALEAKPTAGLIPIVPSSVDKSGGTASANTLGQVTFANVSSISLNGVFTSAYANYRISVVAGAGTTGTDMRFRLRASGTDRTNANHYSGGMLVREQGSSVVAGTTGGTNFDLARLLFAVNSNSSMIDLNMPQVSTAGTSIHWNTWSNDGSGGYSFIAAGLYSSLNSNDGFTLYSSGTFSGLISVYGYND